MSTAAPAPCIRHNSRYCASLVASPMRASSAPRSSLMRPRSAALGVRVLGTCVASARQLPENSRDITIQGLPSKCRTCVDEKRKQRWQPPFAFASPSWSAGEDLTRAVQDADLNRVQQLLAVHGCSISNHMRQRQLSTPALGSHRSKVWDAEGNPWPDDGPDQPCTPLRLVVFRISDCCLTRSQMATFCDIAKLLISHGADAVDACDYMCSRYGAFAPEETGDGGQCRSGAGSDASTHFEAVCMVVEVAARLQRAVNGPSSQR
jgi:hypothetical protein